MDILITVLSIVAFSVIVLVIYNGLKAYVLFKVKANKWLVLAAAVILFMVPMIIWPNMPTYASNYIIPGIFVVLFLWFMDLSGFMRNKNVSKQNSKTNITSANSKRDKKKEVVIRPKAKPNRVKNRVKVREK
jgi:hypothetical protein